VPKTPLGRAVHPFVGGVAAEVRQEDGLASVLLQRLDDNRARPSAEQDRKHLLAAQFRHVCLALVTGGGPFGHLLLELSPALGILRHNRLVFAEFVVGIIEDALEIAGEDLFVGRHPPGVDLSHAHTGRDEQVPEIDERPGQQTHILPRTVQFLEHGRRLVRIEPLENVDGNRLLAGLADPLDIHAAFHGQRERGREKV